MSYKKLELWTEASEASFLIHEISFTVSESAVGIYSQISIDELPESSIKDPES
jgi:hypothetical protein